MRHVTELFFIYRLEIRPLDGCPSPYLGAFLLSEPEYEKRFENSLVYAKIGVAGSALCS